MSFGGGSSPPPPPPVQATTVPMRQLTEVPTAAPNDKKTRSFMDAGAAATFIGSGGGAQDPTKPFGSTMLGGG